MDIDMCAGTQALYELFTLQGKEVYVHGSQTYSASVTKDLQERTFSYPTKEIESGDQLFAVDVSSIQYLGEQCQYPLDQFAGIYDHHFESTDYWRDKLGERAVIQEVGAASTLVAELIQEEGMWAEISFDTKVLLAAAIISNSQNFKFAMTSRRDHVIYDLISNEVNLESNFAETYFLSIQDTIVENIQDSLKNDTKERVALTDKTFTIAQLEMWDTEAFLKESKKEVQEFLNNSEAQIRFFLSASLSEDRTYFIVVDEKSESFLTNLLGISFADGQAVMNKIMIRKEVIKEILS